MSTKTIEMFFSGKTLEIPGYQRDYAWTERNVDDLFGDIEEALEVGGGHYLGTFILSQQNAGAPVQVVDGQQRLTTLTMVLDAFIDSIADEDIKQHYRNTFIRHPVKGAKFRVLGDNEVFFRDMLAEKNPVPESDGQQRLLNNYLWIRQRVQALQQSGGQILLTRWLICISEMEVLEFIEPNEGKAIRMFQSVNDRGVPLAKMDIVKSLLVYYSNRYLGGELDNLIARKFGEAFRSFSRLKRLAHGDGYKVRLIDRDSFKEDDVLRYHYFAFDGTPFNAIAGADYSATSETVLESFLKPELKRLRSDTTILAQFITTYIEDLAGFFSGLEQLLISARENRQIYMLFVVQDLSATLYPLVIRLFLKGWLPQTGQVADARSLLSILEMADLRVFKLRGTNPQANIFRITRDLPTLSLDEVIVELQNFCQRFMPDALLASRLVDEDLYRNQAVPRMLLEAEDQARAALNLPPLAVSDLAKLNREGLTVEHILPQVPAFNIEAYGFTDAVEYELHKHRFGNLTLLEGSINSACSDRTIEDKMSAPSLYMASDLFAVTNLSAQYAGNTKRFERSDLGDRSKTLADQMLSRWPINMAVSSVADESN